MYEPLIRVAARNAVPQPAPINPSWILSGTPRAHSVPVAASDDRAVSAWIWECTAGRFIWRYDCDETIHVLDGAVTISSQGEEERHLVSGDTIHFSRGAVAIWTVDAHIRKIAFCRSAPPRPLALLMRIARKVRRRASAWLRIPAAALPT